MALVEYSYVFCCRLVEFLIGTVGGILGLPLVMSQAAAHLCSLRLIVCKGSVGYVCKLLHWSVARSRGPGLSYRHLGIV